jgi:hypothetical protein
MSHNPYDQRLTNLEARYGSGLRSVYASKLHSDFVQATAERKAARHLAQKRYERHQRYTNIFLGFSITFIAAVTIATGLIMWADALA